MTSNIRPMTLALATALIGVLWTLPAAGQVYPYFGPANGVLFGSTSSAITRSATATDLATLVSCSTTQIVFTNSTPSLTCSSHNTWLDSPGTLTLTSAGPAEIQHWTNANGNTDQKDWVWYLDTSGSTDTLHGALVDHADGNRNDWLAVDRSTAAGGFCQASGSLAGYQVCLLHLTTATTTIFNGDNDFAVHGLDNNDSDMIFRNDSTGTAAYLFYEGMAGYITPANTARWLRDIVPLGYAGGSGNPIHCRGSVGQQPALTLPYSCDLSYGNVYFQVGEQGQVNPNLPLDFLIATYGAGPTVTTTLGQYAVSGATTSQTNIQGGSVDLTAYNLTGTGNYKFEFGSASRFQWLTANDSATNAIVTLGDTSHASSSVTVQGGSTGGIALAGDVLDKGTTFTASGCAITSLTGGAVAGSFASGTTGTCTVVITFTVTAPNGWVCRADDLASPTTLIGQSASSPTSCTVTGITTSGDTVNFMAVGF
jgi:hypothetical protein